MKRFSNVIIIPLLVLVLNAQSVNSDKIDVFISKVRAELNLNTGLSIGVVVGDEILYSKGFGFSNIEQNISVTPDSPFYIASATKSFTATLIQFLSEKDTLNIDKPISSYLPELTFENENLNSDLITLRDLLCHRSGIFSIPSVVRTAYTGQHTFDKMIEIYKTARFTTPEFKYTNDGYVVTSLILDHLYKKPWQQLMKENLFIPLKMTNTSCQISDYNPDLLRAYNTNSGQADRMKFLKADNTMHAAGGIVSTANDLCNWLIFNLNDGKTNQEQILSDRKISEIHSSQVSCSTEFWYYKRFAYGLGWYLSDYNNELLIHHFGGYAGARSHISFMPNQGIGVVALTNDDGDGFYVVDLVADYIYNSYLGKDADSIAKEELNVITSRINKNAIQEDEEDSSEQSIISSMFSYNDLVGNYTNSEFGEVAVENDSELNFHFGNMGATMTPISEDKFLVKLAPFNAEIGFTEVGGQITELILYGPSKIIFTKN